MGRYLAWDSIGNIATNLLDANPIAILVTVAIALGFPLLLHYLLYRTAASPKSSSFILLGPSGAGKTALFSLLESTSSRIAKAARPTHTSQTSTVATITLPPTIPIASNRYRSVNDPSLSEASRNPVKYELKDTPGHGKLRGSQGLSYLETSLNSKKEKERTRGVIFVVDAAALSEGGENLRDAAGYLHDILLLLQKNALNKGSRSFSKVGDPVSVLVAANKQDLFTALPPGSVRNKLETEIDRIRKSRKRGLMDASVGSGINEDEDEVLGGDDGHGIFSFNLLEEVGIKVDVVGGAVKAEGDTDPRAGVRKWEEWIGMCL
ncbi:SRP receptor beta subunit (Srp102) [Rasamsonia emersonii CBS 393.64]|uniref:Signal recognition particle receptor subunit beta n=1 Tax=Rasamsonia emersonii (strain ATCC 16479 / CBS 393.64 / IMI 116815) TaxID=1408163 RepID=A0A0F4YM18_RASE3|nr:SRP receptor beta subunit (Srp102) [Rasamsonia emersonii CBS 393.64]KKA19337.1 SRP receptor beta subunit (Srp102) [Rasamsonia emersonii CBS 393.64]